MRAFEISEELKPGRKVRLSPHLEKVWSRIESDCSDIIRSYRKTNRIFYRGISKDLSPIFKGNPRQNRRPLTTPRASHAVFELVLKELGFKTLRSNCLSVTSRLDDGADYYAGYDRSRVYMIFPKNGFNYVTSNLPDLFTIAEGSILTRLQKVYVSNKRWDEYEEFDQKYKKAYFNQDFKKRRNLWQFIADDWNKYKDDVVELYKEEFKEWDVRQNKGLEEALEKGSEVMISHVEYYAINYAQYGDQVRRLLFGEDRQEISESRFTYKINDRDNYL